MTLRAHSCQEQGVQEQQGFNQHSKYMRIGKVHTRTMAIATQMNVIIGFPFRTFFSQSDSTRL